MKIVAVSSFSIVAAVSDRLTALIPALVMALVILVMARLPINFVFSRLTVINGFILLLWCFLPFTMEGSPLFKLGPLVATREGMYYAATITIKSNAIMMILIAFMTTTSIYTVARALRYFRVSEKLVHIVFFTYRYLHVIHLEYQRLAKTVKIRGFQPGNNWHTYRTYAYLIGMLLVRSYERTQRVRAAMICRGFRGRFYNLVEFRSGGTDFLVIMLVLLGVLSIGLLQWTRIIY